MFDVKELEKKKLSELYEIAKELSIENYEELRKKDLIEKILEHQAALNGIKYCEGVLEIMSRRRKEKRGGSRYLDSFEKKRKITRQVMMIFMFLMLLSNLMG